MSRHTEVFADEDSSRALALSEPPSKTPQELAQIIRDYAESGGWIERVCLRIDQRWYERIYQGLDYDLWVISWMPGQSTGFHDHGQSAGAFLVTTGVLEEHRHGEPTLVVPAGMSRSFGSDYKHDVLNTSIAPAVSLHAYSPPLTDMNEYEVEEDKLVARREPTGRVETLRAEDRTSTGKKLRCEDSMTIDRMLSIARSRLRRLSPQRAYQRLIDSDAILVDIRPEDQRRIEGAIPKALAVERNVLEWRLDPSSGSRLPIATDHDLEVIVLCSEGYTSSLAAAALQDLGLRRATDVVGGFHAWKAAGLPTRAPVVLETRSLSGAPS